MLQCFPSARRSRESSQNAWHVISVYVTTNASRLADSACRSPMVTTIRRTYAARAKPSLSSSSPAPINSLKRKLRDSEPENVPILKKRCTSKLLSEARPSATKSSQRTLTQLHFALDCSVLRTCSLCSLTYTKGAPDDETLHRSHCGRVQRGMEWGREEEREVVKAGVDELTANIKLKNGTSGRIICFPANAGGRIGTKVGSCISRRSCVDKNVAFPLARDHQSGACISAVDGVHPEMFQSISLPCSFLN
jgi:hypothetical protein